MKTINDNSTGNSGGLWPSRSFHMRSLLAAALFLAMLVVGCSVLSVTADEADAEEYQDGVYKYTVSDGKATITGYTGPGGNLNIPGSLGGYEVIAIGDDAFQKNSNTINLTSVTIPDSIKTIGKQAFQNLSTNLKTVTIGSGVETIGEYAFYNCAVLETVKFNEGSKLTSIGSYAFSDCYALTSINIPNSSDSLIRIGDFAFCNFDSSSTYKLESVTIGGGVSSLGQKAFYQCCSLKSVTFKSETSTFTSIGEETFYGCSSLEAITIPDSVTSIGKDAFYQCTKLTSVTIPNLVATIGECAFGCCSGLTSVTFGSVVTTIGRSAFYDYDLTTGTYMGVKFYEADGTTEIDPESETAKLKGNTFKGTDGKLVLDDPTVLIVDIMDGSTLKYQIKYSLSEDLKATLSEIIGEKANVTEIDIPATVVKNTKTYSVTSIGENAFSGCTGLTSVSFGNGLAAIADWGVKFYGTDGKTQITDVSKLNGNTFKGTYTDGLAQTGSIVITYTTDEDNPVTIRGVTSIADNQFQEQTTIKTVVINDGVKTIGIYAFYQCTALESVEIPDSVTSIGKYAFKECTKLTSVTLGKGIKSLEGGIFEGCTSLGSIIIPGSVTSIEKDVFSGCTGLRGITIPKSVTTIGNSAFYECANLTSVTIESGSALTKIDANVFFKCSALESIKIPESVSSIGDGAFMGCSALKSIIIPDSVTSIKGYMFSGCTSLESVNIPSSITVIGDSMFYECSKLTSITIPDKVNRIGHNAFQNCTGLKSINIPLSVTTFGNDVFKNISFKDYKGNTLTADVANLPGNTFTGNGDGTLTQKTLTVDGIIYALPGGSDVAAIDCVEGKTDVAIPTTVTDNGKTYNVVAVGNNGFKGNTALKTVSMPESVKSIGASAFSGCTGLTKVIFGNKIETIGTGAFTDVTFYNTGGTEKITVSVENLKGMMFELSKDKLCKIDLTTLTDEKGIKYKLSTEGSANTATVIGYTDDVSAELTIPQTVSDNRTGTVVEYTVTAIGNEAFSGCQKLTSVTLPSTVKSIGDQVFFECKELTSINIPESVTAINLSTFQNCEKLATVTVEGQLTEVGGKAFWACSELEFKDKNGKVIDITGSLTKIGQLAFCKCAKLTTVTISDSVTEIGGNAFDSCTGLTTVTIGNGVTLIDEWTFNKCTALTTVTLGNSVTTIKYQAFMGCTGLKSINIPGSVTTIDSTAFDGITFNDHSNSNLSVTAADLSGNTFEGEGNGVLKQKTLTVDGIIYALPGGSDVAAIDCVEGKTDVAIPTTVTDDGKTYNVVAVGNNGFKGNTALKTVSMPGSVKSIGASAFSGCTGLTKVIFGNKIETIGTGAFTGVTFYDFEGSGTIAVSVDNLKGTMFELSEDKLCQIDLTTLTVDGIKYRLSTEGSVNTATAYGYYRTDLPEDGKVTIPQTVSDNRTGTTVTYNVIGIGKNIFYNCTDLKSITIPDSVTSIGENAFYDCTGLTSVALGNGIKSIEEYLFYGCTSLSSVTIPDAVTSIGKGAFEECTSLTAVSIPDAVTEIGVEAFYKCSKVETLTIGNGVITIGEKAFGYCESLKSVTIPDSVTTIGRCAFTNCKALESIAIPDTVTSMGDSMFWYCTALRSAVIGNGITAIGEDMFFSCEALEEVTIGNNVTSIGSEAFRACEKLNGITLPDSVTEIGNYAFGYCGFTSVTFGKNVKTIGDNAFEGCEKLKSVILPNSVESIGTEAFKGCTGLTVVVISAKVTSIDSNAFGSSIKFYSGEEALTVGVKDLQGCTFKGTYDKLVKVTSFTAGDFEYTFSGSEATVSGYTGNATDLAIPETATDSSTNVTYTVTGIGEGVFKDKTALVSVTLPDKMTTIGNSAFKGCTELQTVNMPKSLTYLGGSVFSGCTKLANITIPDSVTTIGANAFNSCKGLVSVTIPNGVKTIEGYTFAHCTSLASVTISDSVTSIDAEAFDDCTALTTVTFGSGVTTIKTGAFDVTFKDLEGNPLDASATNLKGKTFKGTDGTLKEYVPTVKEGGIVYTLSLSDKTATVSGYEGSPTNVTLLSKVTDLGIECTVKYIGKEAFKGCTTLVSIVIPDSVTEVKDYAFEGCTGLKEVTLGKGITKIASNDPFKDCSGIKLTVLCSVSTTMFTKMDFFTELVLGDNITVGELAFNECEKLVSVTFGNGITAIGDNAFFQCAALETVVLSNSVTDIGNGAFRSCPALKSVTFGTDVTTIGSNAFSVTFKDTEDNDLEVSAANMKGSTFTGSDGVLKKDDTKVLTVGGIVYTLSPTDKTATVTGYEGTPTNVTIPSKVTDTETGTEYTVEYIGKEAFKGCTSLVSIVIPDSVTEVKDYAFEGCTGLKEVTLGKGITSIASNDPFKDCSGIKMTVHCPVKDGMFSGKDCITELVLGDDVTVGELAFSECNKLVSVTFGNGISTIGAKAFFQCAALETVVISDSVTDIGSYAFMSCKALRSITFGTNVTTIGSDVFSVTFKDAEDNDLEVSAANMKGSIFTGSEGVLVKEDASILTEENGIRYKLSADGTATVIGYTGTATDVTIPSTVSNSTATYNVIKIGDGVFKGKTITSVVIGDNVTDIGKGAFSGITGLASVTFGKGVRTIGEEAFYCCTGLTSVTIGTGVKTIGDRAFYGCIGLTSVTFNGNVETIGIDAFNGCTGFTSVEIPDSVKDINASAFSGCTSLKSVRIGNHTATIGERAFYGCPLTSLSIPASVTTIGEEAFNCVKFYDSDGQEITVLDAEHLRDSTFEGTDGSELKRTGSAGGNGDDGLSTGAVVTVWIGILLAILVIICAYLYYRKMNSQEDELNSEL